MRPLDAFLSLPEQRLLSAVLSRPGSDFGTVELIKRMGSSRSAGSAVIKRWLAAGFLHERKVGNQRRLGVNVEFLLYDDLRRMALKTIGLTEPLADALRPIASRLTAAFVFGSVAAGTDTAESDIDLALVGKVDLFDISPLLDRAEKALGRRVHANVYDEAEWAAHDDRVLDGIRRGPRVDLMEALNAKTD